MYHPDVGDILGIANSKWHVLEHPAVPGSGIPYGQEGRAGIVFQLGDEAGNLRALKVFKPAYRQPYLVGLSDKLRPFAALPGLAVCDRAILTPQRHEALLRQHPDLLYAVLMPWINGQTWHDILSQQTPLSAAQSLALAYAFTGVLLNLEQHAIAHGDLSGSNLIVKGLDTDGLQIELVDVEQLYAPSLSRPEGMPGGSPGYAHHRAADGLWQPDMDRFSGAVLLAEMLGWCDARVREAAAGDTYFDEGELQQDCPRYNLLHAVLAERWSSDVAGLLDRAWRSDTLAQCPTFGEWRLALPSAARPGEVRDAAYWIAAAQAAMATKDYTAALAAYRNALPLVEPASSLAEEISLIIAGLEARTSKQNPVKDIPATTGFRPRWLWVLAPLLLLLAAGLVYAGVQAFNGQSSLATPVATTALPPATLSPPTATSEPPTDVPAVAPTEPPATATSAATEDSPATAVPATATIPPTTQPTATTKPTATLRPSSTPTRTPLSTSTPAPVAVAPEILGPEHGIYQNPFTFSWSSQAGVTYQVTLRNVDQAITHQSDWLSGGSWATDIPDEQFGNWEWWVTSSEGQRSANGTFVFDPFPNIGGGTQRDRCARADINGDGSVDSGDVQIVLANFNPLTPQPGNPADIWGPNGEPDGYVESDDYNYVLSQFGCTY